MSRIRYTRSVNYAKIIRGMRAHAGFSQAELARRSGLPRTVINAYEHGKREPGATALERLADACDCNVSVVPRTRIDPVRNAEVFADVLDLAEHLPHRPSRTLDFPPMGTP